jgi:hypothetical protein
MSRASACAMHVDDVSWVQNTQYVPRLQRCPRLYLGDGMRDLAARVDDRHAAYCMMLHAATAASIPQFFLLQADRSPVCTRREMLFNSVLDCCDERHYATVLYRTEPGRHSCERRVAIHASRPASLTGGLNLCTVEGKAEARRGWVEFSATDEVRSTNDMPSSPLPSPLPRQGQEKRRVGLHVCYVQY